LSSRRAITAVMAGSHRQRIHLAFALSSAFALLVGAVAFLEFRSALLTSHHTPRNNFSRHAWYTNSLAGRVKAPNLFSTRSGITGSLFLLKFSNRFARASAFNRSACFVALLRCGVLAMLFLPRHSPRDRI